MFFYRAILAWGLLCASVAAADPAPLYRLQGVKVIDGDTLAAEIVFPLGVTVSGKIRCSDFDAWETSRHRATVGRITEAEIEKGKQAKAAVAKLLREHAAWVQLEDNRDAYGRILGRVYFAEGKNRRSLAEWAKQEGHCR